MSKSIVWFDIGYTLLYIQREITYQKALRKFGIDVRLADLQKEFHLTDKLFMREYPGFLLQPPEVVMPVYLGILNYRMGLGVNLCEVDSCWQAIKNNVNNCYDDCLGSRKVGMSALIINRFGSQGVEEIEDCPIISQLSDIFVYIDQQNGAPGYLRGGHVCC